MQGFIKDTRDSANDAVKAVENAHTLQVQMIPCLIIPLWYNHKGIDVRRCYRFPGEQNDQYRVLIIRSATIYRRKIVREILSYESEDSGSDDDDSENVLCYHYQLKIVRMNDSGSGYISLSCPITRKNGLLGKDDNRQFDNVDILVEDAYGMPSLMPEIPPIDEITKRSNQRACYFKLKIRLVLPTGETYVFSMHSSEKKRKEKNPPPPYNPFQYCGLTKVARINELSIFIRSKFVRFLCDYIIHRMGLSESSAE